MRALLPFLRLPGAALRGLSLLVCLGAMLASSDLCAQMGAPAGEPKLTPLPHPEIAPPDFTLDRRIPWWLLAAGIPVVWLLVGGLLWFLLWQKKARPPSLHAPLKLAIESLQLLRSHLDEMTPPQVAHEVSAILRQYLLLRYSLPAPYRTTEEIYHSNLLATRQPLRDRFEPVAILHDRMEFAPQPRTQADSEKLVDAALEALQEEHRHLPQPGLAPFPSQPSFPPATSPPPPLSDVPSPPVPATVAVYPPPLPVSLEKSPPKIPPPSAYQP